MADNSQQKNYKCSAFEKEDPRESKEENVKKTKTKGLLKALKNNYKQPRSSELKYGVNLK